MSKPRVVKDYEKLDESILQKIKLEYPHGFEKHLITFKNAHGAFVSALPFEADDYYYLIRMTKAEARDIIEDDDDYDDDGKLRGEIKDEYIDNLEDIEVDLEDLDEEDQMEDEV